MTETLADTSRPVVLLGVTGSIAAYKAATLCSLLVKNHYNVHVIMTANALKLIGEITFRTLSRERVITDLFDGGNWKPRHIALAEQAHALLIAPATANIMAKMAHGIADDALSTTALSVRCPVFVAPAMNPAMWQHPATQENCKTLQARGVRFIGPASGALACGTSDIGRMSEPEFIFKTFQNHLLTVLQGDTPCAFA